jgi:hypothetical protein
MKELRWIPASLLRIFGLIVASGGVIGWISIYFVATQNRAQLHLQEHIGFLTLVCAGVSWIIAGNAVTKHKDFKAWLCGILGAVIFGSVFSLPIK